MTLYQQHKRKWANCSRCLLHKQRRRIVLARGTIPCNVAFVGEAPGASEDCLGKPFCGPAGHLLQVVINQSLEGCSYLLTNLVACFPREAKEAGDNEPPDDAIKACAPRLVELIEMAKPGLVVLVGKLARKRIPWECVDERGWCEIIHPAAILRMDLSQRPLAIKRCIATIRGALE